MDAGYYNTLYTIPQTPKSAHAANMYNKSVFTSAFAHMRILYDINYYIAFM